MISEVQFLVLSPALVVFPLVSLIIEGFVISLSESHL